MSLHVRASDTSQQAADAAPVCVPLASVRKEEVGAAHRAERRRVDAFRRDARFNQLIAVRFLKIDARVSLASLYKKLIGVREAPAKSIDDFRADLVAARSGGRTRSRPDVLGPCAKLVQHPPKRLRNNRGERAVPPGVNRGGSARQSVA